MTYAKQSRNFRVSEYYNFKSQPGPVTENATLDYSAGNRARESSPMFRQLSYGGRRRKHGHEFSIYTVVMPRK